MKILWISDSPNMPTGYGIVTKNVLGYLNKEFKVSCFGLQNQGQPIEFEGYMVYGINNHIYGKDILQSYINELNPDFIVLLYDLFVFDYLKNINFKNSKLILYFPIDGHPIPTKTVEILKIADKRIAMSFYGQKMAKEELSLDSEVIYHGVDTKLFRPLDKIEIKRKYALEDKFIVGCVAKNTHRKMIPHLLKAFKIFSKDKEDVILYLHTPLKGSFDLIELSKRLKINVKFSNIQSPMSFNDERMNELYNLFDIHALTTTGEGFGLPILESMACGIPNVVPDYTTSRELIEERGELVPLKTTFTGSLNVERGLVDIEEFAKELQFLYDNPDVRKKYSIKSLEFAKQYNWENICEKWKKVLKS